MNTKYTRFDQADRAIAKVVGTPYGKDCRNAMAYALKAHRAAGDRKAARNLQTLYIFITGHISK